MTRQQANKKILEHIWDVVIQYPDMRFNQILQDMNIEKTGEDRWYLESEDCLKGICSLTKTQEVKNGSV